MTSWEQDERAAKSKFVAQSRPAFYYSRQQGEHESDKLESLAKLRVFISNISSLPSVKAAIYDEKKKILYLSVRVFSTVVLIVDTVNKQTNITNRTETC